MDETKYRVAIIGCGYMGQKYVEAYHTYPDTEIVAIASKLSADLGSAPVKLPLPDRSLSLYPSERRWVGRDQEGRPL